MIPKKGVKLHKLVFDGDCGIVVDLPTIEKSKEVRIFL